MRTSGWALAVLLIGLLHARSLQAGPIGPRTTGSVGILTASGEVCIDTCSTIPDMHACSFEEFVTLLAESVRAFKVRDLLILQLSGTATHQLVNSSAAK